MMEVLRVLLLALLVLPTVGAVIVACLGAGRLSAIRWISLGVTLAGAALAFILAGGFLSARAGHTLPDADTVIQTFRAEIVPGATASNPHDTTWKLLSFGRTGAVRFYLGLDGLNVWLIVLTAVLMVSSVLISWNSINERGNEFYAWLLLLGAGMLGVFLSFDILLFYVFFELTLVPLFFLIGIWGGPERRHAARKFFIYTLAGSLITFLGLLAVVLMCYQSTRVLTFSIPELVSLVNERLAHLSTNPEAFREELATWRAFQFWVFIALAAGFAVKVPLVPVHTWLPLAHVEAPTAGSVLLAGVLLKMGTYGFLRLCLPLTPDACLSIGMPLIGTLAVIGIIYGAFCSLAQDDIKKLVAYSSVSHLGFCMLGMFALNAAGLAGSLLQMINHGLSTGALFLLVGMVYDRYHTRKISDFGGLGTRLGLLSLCMVFISLSSIGLPGLNGFVGEALVFFGMFYERPGLAILGTAGIVLGAWYLLSMVRSVFFGPLHEPGHGEHEPVSDINIRELAALGPIMALCLLLGVYPQPLLDSAQPDLQVVTRILGRRAGAHLPLAQRPDIHLAAELSAHDSHRGLVANEHDHHKTATK